MTARSPSFFGTPSPALGSRRLTELTSKIKTPELPLSWIESQRWPTALGPARAAEKAARDPTPKQRLVLRSTLGWTLGEQALVVILALYGLILRHLWLDFQANRSGGGPKG